MWMIAVVIIAGAILSFVLKRLANKVIDKGFNAAENAIARKKNEKNGPTTTNLSDRYRGQK